LNDSNSTPTNLNIEVNHLKEVDSKDLNFRSSIGKQVIRELIQNVEEFQSNSSMLSTRKKSGLSLSSEELRKKHLQKETQ
jgi:hypothetical protein